MKCPYCGSGNIQDVSTNSNTSFFLTQIELDTKTALPGTGIPLDLFICEDCQGVLLRKTNI